MALIDLKNCSIFILDAGSNSLEIKVGEGNLTYSEKRTIEYKKDRGLLDAVREGDQEPVDLSFNLQWEFLRSDTATAEPVTPEEALKQVGQASSWVTTGGDACEPYAVDIVLENILDCSTILDEKIVFSEFRYETLNHDVKQGMLDVSGKCNEVSPTVTRVAL